MDDASPGIERCILRLKQLTREQRAAIANGNHEMLCRIASLLPPLVEALQNARVEWSLDAREALLEAAAACRDAEAFLQTRMRVTAAGLQRIARGRRALKAYAGRTITGARLGGLSG